MKSHQPTMKPVSDASGLGQAIRLRRKEIGLTQTELADAAGTSIRFVSEACAAY